MKSERISISSDESQDGNTYKKIFKNYDKSNEDGNSYISLHQHNWEHCDFCDKLFCNRYEMFKHNISHIIIPLIKQTTYQCGECLHHFTTTEDLASHTSTKHQQLEHRPPDSPVRLKTEDLKEKIPEILQSIVEKQVYVKCEDELKEVFVKSKELLDKDSVNDNNNETPWVGLKEESVSPADPNLAEERVSSPIDEDNDSVRDRILFEDDFDDNLFKDLTTDCQVSLESICQQINPEFDEPAMVMSGDDKFDTADMEVGKDLLRLEEETSAEVDTGLLRVRSEADDANPMSYSKAIHYDDLVVAKVCVCRLCGRELPNRFTLLQHELKHIIMKPKHRRNPMCCICDRQIAGNYHNLRRHIQDKHPEKANLDTQYSTQNCPKCHLKYYNYTRHCKNYHELYKCEKCYRGFDSEKLRSDHDCKPNDVPSNVYIRGHSNGYKDNFEVKTNVHGAPRVINRFSYEENLEARTISRPETRILKMCNLCFSFMKIYMQNRNNYEVVGVRSELGVQQICDKCHNKFFEVKLVKRKPVGRDSYKHKSKPISNIQRLKNVQNRLKMMNNKYK